MAKSVTTFSQPLISLLIPTCNRKDEILKTLTAMSPPLLPENEIIVFENGCSDGTAAAVSEQFPEVNVIRESVGIPAMAARNRLFKVALGKYAISLDDDSEIVSPGFVSSIADYFEGHPDCAVLAFSIYWGEDLPPTIRPPGGRPFRVSSYVGCGHAWRMTAWRSIREYPEWIDFYGEEDFGALNLLKGGWQVHYLPTVLVHHRVNMAKRKADKAQRLWRYGRQLRSGIFMMLVFYPLRALPKRLAFAFWTQIRLRLIEERDWAVVPSLLWVVAQIIRKARLIWQSRTPLTPVEWTEWNALPPAVIFWEPKEN